MTAQNVTVDDLRTVAHNLQSEGQNSRAEVVYSAATRMEALERMTDELNAAIKLLLHDIDNEYLSVVYEALAKAAETNAKLEARLEALEKVAEQMAKAIHKQYGLYEALAAYDKWKDANGT
jgi:hypothetical protein